MKTLFLITLSTLLFAEGMDNQALDGIYTEAIFFVGLFVSMYILSFFISRKNAKKFEKNNPLEIRRQKAMKRKTHEEAMELRLEELSKLLFDGIITEPEFKVLRNNLDYIVK